MNTIVNGFDKNTNTPHKKVEVCRLCGEKSLDYISIFQDKDNYILEKMSRCLPIVIFPNDKLPSNVCKRCLNYLNISCKLILTAVEVDERLRRQLDQNDACTDKDVASCEASKISEPNIASSLTLKELRRQAVCGPIECDLCDMNFQDVDTFDNHMEQFHFLKWRCSLCDNSFYESTELIAHKILRHSGNIVICNSCRCTMSQNNKQKLTDRNVQNSKITSKNIPNNQIRINNTTNEQSIVNKKTIDYQIKREITDATNAQNDQNIEREITNKKNAQNEIGYKKGVTSTEETAASINLTVDTKIDIDETKYKDLLQASMKATDNNSDLGVNNETTENRQRLSDLKTVKEKGLFCETCKFHFEEERHFEAHNRIHVERNVTCITCTAKCSSTYDLFLHKRKKHNLFKKEELKYACRKCGRFFSHSWSWENHDEDECFKTADKCCKYCNAMFTTDINLINHLKRKHNRAHFGHECSRCNAVFKKKWDLNKHVQEVHDLRPAKRLTKKSTIYICKFCGKKLNTSQSLGNHERIHTGEMPYSCPICHQSFRTYVTKWTHVQRHQKGTFVCDRCGKCFSYKRNLRVHIMTHLPVEARKYQCNICGKKFVRNSTLTIHKRIHSGVRPYECDVCSFSFKQKGDMKRHRMRHFKNEDEHAKNT